MDFSRTYEQRKELALEIFGNEALQTVEPELDEKNKAAQQFFNVIETQQREQDQLAQNHANEYLARKTENDIRTKAPNFYKLTQENQDYRGFLQQIKERGQITTEEWRWIRTYESKPRPDSWKPEAQPKKKQVF